MLYTGTMGIRSAINKLLGTKSLEINSTQFKTVTEHQPVFSNWNGHMYQQTLVRTCIERIAAACAKLDPEVLGTAEPRIARAIKTSPNQYMTWPNFLKRCATIYYNDTNLFIVPAYKPGTDIITGIYPLRPAAAEIVEYDGEPWVRFTLFTGEVFPIELKNVCIVTRFQYESDFFGDPNNLDATLNLLHSQEEAQKQAIVDGASIRFIATVNGSMRPEDVEAKRKQFTETNLSSANTSGLMLVDSTFVDVKPLSQQNWTIPSEEMTRIENSVFDYFGINRKILQNDYNENEWDAFYEGCIEPFSVSLGEGLSHMLYTMRERPKNRIMFSANRLEYSSAASKRNMNRDMLDRGVITINDARQILQLPPIPGGDMFIIRGEYKLAHSVDEMLTMQLLNQFDGVLPAGELYDNDIDSSDKDKVPFDSEGFGSSGDTDSGDASDANRDH